MAGLECECGCTELTVTDSRPSGPVIRRRRRCENCGERYTTVEVIIQPQMPLRVEFMGKGPGSVTDVRPIDELSERARLRQAIEAAVERVLG